MCRAWSRSAFACFTARTVSISREPRDRLRLDVDDDARRDVVDDDRPVARLRDRLEVRDDPALRRLVVVRRDDEERRRAELVRRLGQVDRVRGRVRAGAGDDRRLVADRLERGADQVEPLVVGERRALAGRAGDDDAVRAVLDEMARERLERVEVDAAVVVERRDHRRQDVAEHAGSVRVILDGRWRGSSSSTAPGTAPGASRSWSRAWQLRGHDGGGRRSARATSPG